MTNKSINYFFQMFRIKWVVILIIGWFLILPLNQINAQKWIVTCGGPGDDNAKAGIQDRDGIIYLQESQR
jgi:hypothetical protein